MGQIPNLEKLMAFCWLVSAPLLLYIDKRGCILARARVLLRVESRTGVGKFSLHMQGSSYHTLVPGGQVIVSLQVQRCSLRWRLYRLCGILIDEMAEK